MKYPNTSICAAQRPLTASALAAGYIIGYADHLSPVSLDAIRRLAEVANEIPLRWCIDTDRIHLTGHSDGGSTATPDGCEVYGGCVDEVEVRYCEGTLEHGYWPNLNGSMLAFFDLFG